MLTGTELFASFDVKGEWQRKGGLAKNLTEPAYVDEANPLTLAEITQQVYLDLPPFHKDIEDRWSRANSRWKKGTLEP